MQLNGNSETIGKSPSLDKPLIVEEHSQTDAKQTEETGRSAGQPIELFRRNQGFNTSLSTRKDLSNQIDLPDVQLETRRSRLRRRLEERLSPRYPSLCLDQKQQPLST